MTTEEKPCPILAQLDEERNASWREEVALQNQIRANSDRMMPHLHAMEFLQRERDDLNKRLEVVRDIGYERNQRYVKAMKKKRHK